MFAIFSQCVQDLRAHMSVLFPVYTSFHHTLYAVVFSSHVLQHDCVMIYIQEHDSLMLLACVSDNRHHFPLVQVLAELQVM